ncbi:MAG: O-antigen ligase family protein [Candidatus Promineifilaceae bacterium]|nr:O-antigen ligase family protein [Candidatus Promineifilaceae bacterium]
MSWPWSLPGLRSVLFGLLLLAVVAVPLAFSPWHYNAFELPKALLVRGLAGLTILMLAYLPRRVALRLWRERPLVAPLLALAGALVAATIFSIDSRLSLWGSYDRQFGLLTWLAPLLLFLAGLMVLQPASRRRLLVRALLWGSVPVVTYGLIQGLGADPFAWASDGASAVLATMGRSNFLGAYLVMIIPLTVGQLGAATRRWPWMGLLVAQLLVLALTRARAAWLGLLAALLTFGLLWLHQNGRRRLAWRLTIVFGLVIVAALLLVVFLGVPARLAEGGSPAARLAIWRASLPLLAARPLLGYGLDAMQVAFQQVFPPELVYYQGRFLTVDRAHNLWLDLGLSAGLLGLVAYVALLFSVGGRIWRRLGVTTDRADRFLHISLVAALVGHLGELQLSFETVGTAVLFWLLLAAAAAGPNERPADAPAAHDQWSVRPWKSLPLALAFVGVLAVLTVRPLLADGVYWRGQQGDPASPATLRHYVEATQQWPIEPLYHLALGQAYWVNGQPAAAVSEAVAAAQLRPADARWWAAVGDLYARWGARDPARYTQALAAYRRAVALAPNTAAYHTALGLVLADSGQLAEGIAAVERAVALDATDAAAYGHLARLYEAADRPERAAWAAAQARRWASLNDS